VEEDLIMFYITLLRHGESEGNALNIIQGQSDMPLTDKGRQQAELLGKRWLAQGVTFDWVIASPQARARQTAEIVAGILGLPVEFDPVWMERAFGSVEGQNVDAYRKEHPEADFYHPYIPVSDGGESTLDLYMRACQGVQGVMRRPAGRYLIVSHGALLNMVNFTLLGIAPQGNYNSPRFRFGNTAYVSWNYKPDTRQWYLLNFVNPEEWAVAEGADKA
jgi:probable phosphoglycerate mutase